MMRSRTSHRLLWLLALPMCLSSLPPSRQIRYRNSFSSTEPIPVSSPTGSGGAGTLTHLAMEQFKLATNLDMVHVPYRGIGQAFVDILGKRTQAMLPGLAAALPYIKANKVKALAVTGAKRHPLLPDVPTFEELGYEGFEAVQWYGIVGPANMPAPIVKYLNDEIAKILQTPKLRERLSSEALQPMAMTPVQFGRYMQEDIARWRKLAKKPHIDISD